MGTTGNHFHGSGYHLGPLGPVGTSPGASGALVALTGSQRLVFSVCALIATVVLIVWPMVRPKHYSKRELDDMTSHMRLKREIEHHGPSD